MCCAAASPSEKPLNLVRALQPTIPVCARCWGLGSSSQSVRAPLKLGNTSRSSSPTSGQIPHTPSNPQHQLILPGMGTPPLPWGSWQPFEQRKGSFFFLSQELSKPSPCLHLHQDSRGKQIRTQQCVVPKKACLGPSLLNFFGLTEGGLEVEKDNYQQEMAHPCVLSLVHPWACRLLIIWRHIGADSILSLSAQLSRILSFEATVKIYNQAARVSHFHKSWDTSGR